MKNYTNYWAEVISRLAPEKQAEARQAIADKQMTPLLLEAIARQLEEKLAESLGKAGSNGNAQDMGEVISALRALEKRGAEKNSSGDSQEKMQTGFAEVTALVGSVREDLRKLEDKTDTLVPYQIWKVAVVAGLALVIGVVASWNIRPIYKRWQWEQQQMEAR